MNLKKPSTTQGESWKFQWRRRCLGTKKHSVLQDEAKSGESNRIPKTKHTCIEARESTRKRLESSLPKDHEDHRRQRIQFDDSL